MADVDAYLADAPEPHRSSLLALRDLLRAVVPHGEEALSYGVPAIKVDGRPVAGYAYHVKHWGYYPHSEKVLPQVDPALLEGLDWSRGTLRFAPDAVPSEALVRRLVELRLDEIGA